MKPSKISLVTWLVLGIAALITSITIIIESATTGLDYCLYNPTECSNIRIGAGICALAGALAIAQFFAMKNNSRLPQKLLHKNLQTLYSAISFLAGALFLAGVIMFLVSESNVLDLYNSIALYIIGIFIMVFSAGLLGIGIWGSKRTAKHPERITFTSPILTVGVIAGILVFLFFLIIH